MQTKINRITDILRRDDGISGAMHYTEQISWVLFLKFIHDFELTKDEEAQLDGTTYTYVIAPEYRWDVWACPKSAGKADLLGSLGGDDLLEFVNRKLFPYLKSFKSISEDVKSIKYKIGAIFEYLDNRIANGHTLREVLDIIDALDFHDNSELFQLSQVYESLLQEMGSDGGNSGEFYTPRAVIRAVVEAIDPQAGERVYDPAAGSCGFLIEANRHIRQARLSTDQLRFVQRETFYGNEKTPLSYVMGVMNMILHGVESPNISKTNTLTRNIRDIEERERFEVILANPPFGGKEKEQIQNNFPVKSNATELLFLQHMMKSLKLGGRCGVVVPEGVLFQTGAAFASVKKELLDGFNLHTIVSLPSGVFLPYSGVKTNILFFERAGSTSEITYHEIVPPYKLTKNKPIAYEHFEEFLTSFRTKSPSPNSWKVAVADIKDYDISAKNPNTAEAIAHITPHELIAKIKSANADIDGILDDIEKIIGGGKFE